VFEPYLRSEEEEQEEDVILDTLEQAIQKTFELQGNF
jgi:hypothetical protein